MTGGAGEPLDGAEHGTGPVPATTFARRTGVVEVFDDHVGAGRIRDAADHRTWWFHCTRLADGSRTVAAGAAVTFTVRPGPTGLEAVDVLPAP